MLGIPCRERPLKLSTAEEALPDQTAREVHMLSLSCGEDARGWMCLDFDGIDASVEDGSSSISC